jgi:hypothetical protein
MVSLHSIAEPYTVSTLFPYRIFKGTHKCRNWCVVWTCLEGEACLSITHFMDTCVFSFEKGIFLLFPRWLSSEMWIHAAWSKFADISEEHADSTLRVQRLTLVHSNSFGDIISLTFCRVRQILYKTKHMYFIIRTYFIPGLLSSYNLARYTKNCIETFK